MTHPHENKTVHIYDLLVLEGHLDTFGHVNHAKYFEILEEARWDMVTRNGFGLKEIHKVGLGPVILEAKIKFKRELRLREKIRIETQFLSYNKKIARVGHKIFNETKKICAEAEILFGLFDIHRRKIVNPTPEWLRAIGITAADVS
ncbi:MAG: acyl-CoA thioesterase [Bdellovibrio sp.]|nr:acyl-CoA thioesterase [Bdellovibrio sp.]